MYKLAVITVSDRCSSGEREDKSGPAVCALMEKNNCKVVKRTVIPDNVETIKKQLVSDAGLADIVITTGGTGLSPRDVTPEAVTAVCERLIPGMAEAMRSASMKITPNGMLSRSVAGILCKTLIISVPGSPKAAVENLQAILPALPHAIGIIAGEKLDS